MVITRSFERNFLFSAGRHLSNIFAVGGVITILTGCFLFINSTTLETAISVDEFTEDVSNELEILEKEWELKMSKYSYDRYKNDPDWARSHDIQEAKLDAKYDELNRKEGEEYERYVRGIRFRNQGKRQQGAIAPFVFGYGLVAIASAATSSAVFSIERSSRKD